MPVITFDEIHARVADHARRDAARNAPEAVARRAVYQLASALADLGAADRAAVLALLRDEVLALPVTA
jgi:hypothetical protein